MSVLPGRRCPSCGRQMPRYLALNERARFDLAERLLEIDGRAQSVSEMEGELLYQLAQVAPVPLTRRELHEMIWPELTYDGTRVGVLIWRAQHHLAALGLPGALSKIGLNRGYRLGQPGNGSRNV